MSPCLVVMGGRSCFRGSNPNAGYQVIDFQINLMLNCDFSRTIENEQKRPGMARIKLKHLTKLSFLSTRTPILVAYIGVTIAHGPSPQSTAYRYLT